MAELHDKALDVLAQVQKVILGKEKEITEVFMAMLAGGHVLLEDVPGVGKTTLALSFARAMNLDFKRVQFTPDLMASDLTGFSLYRKEEERFVYQEGSLFCQILLADEINRALPKTQSALLEAMEERNVTVDGTTRLLPEPFLVIATQNPADSSGTAPLPESQMDRFIISESLGYPEFENELELAMQTTRKSRIDVVQPQPCLDASEFLQMQQEVEQVFMQEDVGRYLVKLITETRKNPYLETGAGPRATIAMVRMAKASAWMKGRDYVRPLDVAEQFPYVLKHRIRIGSAARLDHKDKDEILEDILTEVRSPVRGRN